MTSHLALLVAEAMLCGGVILLLFHLRDRIGMAPLYLVVGMLQYLQFITASAVRFDVAPGLSVTPASITLFPIIPFVVLLTYVELDAVATRSLAYGLVICNLVLFGVSALTGQHVHDPAVSQAITLPVSVFVQPLRVVAASSLAIFMDVVASIVVFEAVSRRVVGRLFLRLWVSAMAVMALDTLVFTTAAFAGRGSYWTTLSAGVVSKVVGATFYSALTAWYIRAFEAPPPHDGAPRDVFRWLTYRQRYEEVRTLLARDAMTGLYNRGYFEEFAPRQLAHADRARHPMSLVVIDVDRLKTTNDRYGHRAGDELVRFVAEEIRQMVRASDAACRYGGDEFVVVLGAADTSAARVFADRLLDHVRVRSGLLRPSPPWAPASVSIGLSTYPADGRTVEDLLHCADQRLYAGKRAGGGRVVHADEAAA
jgi:diguanylate cyclase (GGDEF)-like protein